MTYADNKTSVSSKCFVSFMSEIAPISNAHYANLLQLIGSRRAGRGELVVCHCAVLIYKGAGAGAFKLLGALARGPPVCVRRVTLWAITPCGSTDCRSILLSKVIETCSFAFTSRPFCDGRAWCRLAKTELTQDPPATMILGLLLGSGPSAY